MEYETNQGVRKLSEEVGLFFWRFPESTEKCNVLRSRIHRFARSSASFCINMLKAAILLTMMWRQSSQIHKHVKTYHF